MGMAERSHRDAMDMVALASELERETSTLMFNVAGGVKILAAYCASAARNGVLPSSGLTPVEVGDDFIKDLRDCADSIDGILKPYREDGGSCG